MYSHVNQLSPECCKDEGPNQYTEDIEEYDPFGIGIEGDSHAHADHRRKKGSEKSYTWQAVLGPDFGHSFVALGASFLHAFGLFILGWKEGLYYPFSNPFSKEGVEHH